jgi:predicted tellurium resistance membrane protein TerC
LGGTVLMVHHPVVILAVVAVAVVISILMIRWMYRAVKKLFRPGTQPSPV